MRMRAITAALALTLAAAGCDTDLTDVNKNPNAPEDVLPQFLLPSVIQNSVNTFLGTSVHLSVASLWVQHTARLDYGYTDRYEFEADFSDARWVSLWTGPLLDVQGVVDRGRQSGAANTEAVGLIMKSWIFHNMTDLWGDLPYSQALQGVGGSTAPPYDTQEEIYDGIISDLKAAQDMINPSAPLFGNNSFDILYGGNMEGWRRFANSLRLRAGMRLSEVNPTKAAQVVASAVADGVILTPNHEAALRWTGAQPNVNPIGQNIFDRPNDYRMSSTSVDTLTALNDPRLALIAEPARNTGAFVGKENGTVDTHGIPFENVSRIGQFFLRLDHPSWLVSVEQVLFHLAEAAQRGWIGGDAATYYHEGIRAAMRRWDVSESDIDAYLAQARVQYNPARWREQIGLQKWIAAFDTSPEAYAEARRLNQPVFLPGSGNFNNDRWPLRFPYPSVEEDRNGANLREARARQGGADPNQPLWWDR